MVSYQLGQNSLKTLSDEGVVLVRLVSRFEDDFCTKVIVDLGI